MLIYILMLKMNLILVVYIILSYNIVCTIFLRCLALQLLLNLSIYFKYLHFLK